MEDAPAGFWKHQETKAVEGVLFPKEKISIALELITHFTEIIKPINPTGTPLIGKPVRNSQTPPPPQTPTGTRIWGVVLVHSAPLKGTSVDSIGDE